MTELKLYIILWYSRYVEDLPDLENEIVADAIHELLAVGMLLVDETGEGKPKYHANRDACAVYLEALCKIPLPKIKWVVER